MTSISQAKRPTQLPNCVREAFLGIDAPKTAVLLDLLFTLGYRSGQWVTLSECLNVCTEHTAIHIVKQGLKHWTIVREAIPQDRPGRPTYKYLLPSIDGLKNDLVAKPSFVTDILNLQDFRNVKSYRMGLHRELIQRGYEANDRQPVEFSRKLMSERLNVSHDTLRRYERELGTYVEDRWGAKPLQHKFELSILPQKKVHDGRFLSIRVMDTPVKRLPCVASIAGMYMKKGYEVWLGWRKCNAYAPYSPYSEQGMRDRFGKWADIVNT